MWHNTVRITWEIDQEANKPFPWLSDQKFQHLWWHSSRVLNWIRLWCIMECNSKNRASYRDLTAVVQAYIISVTCLPSVRCIRPCAGSRKSFVIKRCIFLSHKTVHTYSTYPKYKKKRKSLKMTEALGERPNHPQQTDQHTVRSGKWGARWDSSGWSQWERSCAAKNKKWLQNKSFMKYVFLLQFWLLI